jgi:hypothetical protein
MENRWKLSRRYVQCEDPTVNEKIDAQLKKVVKAILKAIPEARSVIIAGGFGKGEGSFKITEDGEVRCLRDFDIVCIVDQIPNKSVANKIHEGIFKSLGLTSEKDTLFPRNKGFFVDIKFLRKRDLIYPDVYFYDLKAASQVLWGEDVRQLNPWTKKDVPLSSGLRLLFEKVSGLLGHFSAAFLYGKISEEEKETLIYECHKTFIEAGTALCILAKQYEPRYAVRARMLPVFYSTRFPKLARLLPELPRRIEEYTSFRLRFNAEELREDPVDLWFAARSCLLEILRFYLEVYSGKSMQEWKDLPNLVGMIARDYYKPFLGPVLHTRVHLSSKLLLSVGNILFQGLTNSEYVYVVFSDIGKIYLRPLMRWQVSPSLKYFTAGAILLLSLNRDATVEGDLLKEAGELLRYCIPVRISSQDISGWEEMRLNFLKARALYQSEGYHFVK